MGSVVLVVAAMAIAWVLLRYVRTHRAGLVPRRGYGVAADLGAMDDVGRVVIATLARTGAAEARMTLEPVGYAGTPEELVVAVEDDFAAGLIGEWHATAAPLACVRPPGSHLLRLRCLADLQHLTLRVLDQD